MDEDVGPQKGGPFFVPSAQEGGTLQVPVSFVVLLPGRQFMLRKTQDRNVR